MGETERERERDEAKTIKFCFTNNVIRFVIQKCPISTQVFFAATGIVTYISGEVVLTIKSLITFCKWDNVTEIKTSLNLLLFQLQKKKKKLFRP